MSPGDEAPPVSGRALVLGGGGITGIAWELGLIAGLAVEGLDLSTADLVLGTSAGSVVGAQITSGQAVEDLYAAQLAGYGAEVAAKMPRRVLARIAVAVVTTRDGGRFRQRLGRLAVRARAMPQAERLAVIASRLPSPEWPDADLRLTVVDAESGELRVLDRASGVPLVQAVAASCAVPGVYPPISLGGRRYIDGGVRSGTNADLAAGCGRVVVLAPLARGIGPMTGVSEHLSQLRATATVTAVSPDAAALAAIGGNVLNPARRADAARAGRAQAGAVFDEVAAVWTGPVS